MVHVLLSSLFVPFLAFTLLIMNNRPAWVGSLRSGWWSNIVLLCCLIVFIWTMTSAFREAYQSGSLTPFNDDKILKWKVPSQND